MCTFFPSIVKFGGNYTFFKKIIIVHTFLDFVLLLYPNIQYTFPWHFVAKKLGTHLMSQHGVMNNPLKVP
jgi:hypothetical protein